MLALSGLWPGLSVHQARARPADHGFVPDLILSDGDDASVKEASLQILLNHTDTMTGSKHPANPSTIDLLDSDNDNNLQLTIFEFGSNTFKHLKHSNNSPDAASLVAEVQHGNGKKQQEQGEGDRMKNQYVAKPSQAKPGQVFGFWPGLGFHQAKATLGQAKASGFQAKPGQNITIPAASLLVADL
ncbi:hypothetical protein V8E55_009797 [Tylopilus felleus]